MVHRESLMSGMDPIHAEATGEPPTFRDQNGHVGASVFRGSTVSTAVRERGSFTPRILVVDDDRDVRKLCAKALIGSGYKVDTVEDGAVGWQKVAANSYDLLITDHNMPKLSGIELVKKLRSGRMDLPVLLLSGAIPTEEIRQNLSLQLAATLPKPFTLAELLATVEKVLTTKSDSDQPRQSVLMLATNAPV